MNINKRSGTIDHSEFWSHMKAIRHSLKRTLDPSIILNDLDRENLLYLAKFIEELCLDPNPEDLNSVEFLSSSEFFNYRFVPDINVETLLKESDNFRRFHEKSREGSKRKIERLIASIKNYTDENPQVLVKAKSTPPSDEFDILNSFLDNMITKVQSFRLLEGEMQ